MANRFGNEYRMGHDGYSFQAMFKPFSGDVWKPSENYSVTKPAEPDNVLNNKSEYDMQKPTDTFSIWNPDEGDNFFKPDDEGGLGLPRKPKGPGNPPMSPGKALPIPKEKVRM